MNDFNVKNFINKTGEWLKGSGDNNDIVISSRIRLARNLDGFNFVANLYVKNADEIIEKVNTAIEKSKFLKKNIFVDFKRLDELNKHILLERHLVSRELVEAVNPRGVSYTEDEIISIMLNEEDHLRVQVMQSGLNLAEAWRLTLVVESELEKNLKFAFDDSLGYLTACPTNVGTGLRASCMLHLPSLVMTKQINKVLQALSKLNIAVRGLYGEGTQASGNFFQFSNQITLGKDEETIIGELERIVLQIIDHEREARLALNKKKKEKLHDQIWRALGVLKSARLISSKESTALLSMLRLGVDLGVVEGIDRHKLNELFIVIQPAHLQLFIGKVISPLQRDSLRADTIRKYLKNIKL